MSSLSVAVGYISSCSAGDTLFRRMTSWNGEREVKNDCGEVGGHNLLVTRVRIEEPGWAAHRSLLYPTSAVGLPNIARWK